MVANLNAEETARLEEFLAPPRIAVLATLHGSGSPQISPIWYRYSKGRVIVHQGPQCRHGHRGGAQKDDPHCVVTSTQSPVFISLRIRFFTSSRFSDERLRRKV